LVPRSNISLATTKGSEGVVIDQNMNYYEKCQRASRTSQSAVSEALLPKGKITVKAKEVGRRTVEESLFLDGLMQFIVHARAQGTEELFSFRKANGDRVVLTGSSEGGGEEHMRALRTGP
jgi:hypothetical protein